jgi:hypothetical protein
MWLELAQRARRSNMRTLVAMKLLTWGPQLWPVLCVDCLVGFPSLSLKKRILASTTRHQIHQGT